MTGRQKVAACVLSAALGLVGIVTVGLNAVADSGPDAPAYDEAAHRDAVEELLGVTDRAETAQSEAAWERYKTVARNRCAESGIGYEALVAAMLDEGMLSTLRLDAEYVCPDKLPALEQTLTDLGYPADFNQ